ncbi:hypothetical protein MJH12_15265 [bacterium]|nr:hypothetical protein [bacterium]
MEDLNDFFDEGDFAVMATYIAKGQSPDSFTVLFDKDYFESDQGQAGISSAQISIDVQDIKIPKIRQDDQFEIEDISYIVRGIQPDGTGLTTLILEKI